MARSKQPVGDAEAAHILHVAKLARKFDSETTATLNRAINAFRAGSQTLQKQPVNEAALQSVGITLGNVSAIIAEHLRHLGQASKFELQMMLQPEVARLHDEGQAGLADAVAALGAGQ